MGEDGGGADSLIAFRDAHSTRMPSMKIGILDVGQEKTVHWQTLTPGHTCTGL